MKKKTTEPQEILNALKEYVSNSEGILKSTTEIWNGEPLQKAQIRMWNHFELIVKIESLIRLCVFTIEGEGSYSTMSLYKEYSDASIKERNASVCIALELVLTMLPKRDMICYDKILEMLSEIKTNKK